MLVYVWQQMSTTESSYVPERSFANLLEQYRSTRRVRWGHYLEARNKAIQAEALRLGRPEKDIVLPLYWALSGDRPKPITPWIYNLPTQHIVEEVISAFVTGKEPPIKPEEDEGEDELPILEEEEED
ncbi:hypothetical protein QBC32DRAFT_318443 [Pseudoneurospora amorphoporcata]|uniref:Uncharacterized protein n=1 Tax=Pseudoneurospora amorphoporcata TaxID=241081 RepID=A0AAN6NMY7_9PEZI|nr:hypothetical protein QBC32DRAFT_318443 [Pseudoneurospora amorphoporcata]